MVIWKQSQLRLCIQLCINSKGTFSSFSMEKVNFIPQFLWVWLVWLEPRPQPHTAHETEKY